jgi:hypothetical protein
MTQYGARADGRRLGKPLLFILPRRSALPLRSNPLRRVGRWHEHATRPTLRPVPRSATPRCNPVDAGLAATLATGSVSCSTDPPPPAAGHDPARRSCSAPEPEHGRVRLRRSRWRRLECSVERGRVVGEQRESRPTVRPRSSECVAFMALPVAPTLSFSASPSASATSATQQRSLHGPPPDSASGRRSARCPTKAPMFNGAVVVGVIGR